MREVRFCEEVHFYFYMHIFVHRLCHSAQSLGLLYELAKLDNSARRGIEL